MREGKVFRPHSFIVNHLRRVIWVLLDMFYLFQNPRYLTLVLSYAEEFYFLIRHWCHTRHLKETEVFHLEG